MRALVVDDSRAMRAILSRVLSSLGFEVSQAGDGTEALALLTSQGAPDIALVDWNMPGMNGYELVVAIRKDPSWASMRIVMVTTETEMNQISRALTAGANDYITKPFTPDEIERKVGLTCAASSNAGSSKEC